MEYIFDVDKFKNTFKVDETKPAYERRLTHVQEMGYKMYPNKASTKVLPVKEMKDMIGGFFRYALNVDQKLIDYDGLCQAVYKAVNAKEVDKEAIADVISGLFFKEGRFSTTNLGLYPYQVPNNQKESDELAYFLFCVLADQEEIKSIVTTSNLTKFNVLEAIVDDYAKSIQNSTTPSEESYLPIYTGSREMFTKDLAFMLREDMNSEEDLANLFSLYYFQYYVQSSLILDQFCNGDPRKKVELYYALDWERVSKNRKCCTDGWDKVKTNVSHSFAHKTTLGILNNHSGEEKLNYRDFNIIAKQSAEADKALASEIERAEKTYTSYVGDYKDFSKIQKSIGSSETEVALKHLFDCAEQQFINTTRKRARESFNDKFVLFCKDRWIKDRKKSGLVLNLTERDVIFLTKLSIGENEKIRLNDMFKEYEKRGVYLDRTSKEILQEYFAKLNIIDKKSDSGDAQYVRRIL